MLKSPIPSHRMEFEASRLILLENWQGVLK
jgi:hypothetical protein